MIQQNINQAISLAGFLFTQTPQYKQMGRQRELERQLESTLAAGEKMTEAGASPEAILRQGEAALDVRKQLFQNKPTVEGYQAVERSAEAVQRQRGVVEEELYQKAYEEELEAERQAAREAYENEEVFDIADTKVQQAISNKREINNRKMGYVSPKITPFTEMGRKEKRKITTQLEQQVKQEEKEAQRNG